MTDIAPEAEAPRSRTARFWGTWVVALVAALFLQIAGGAVTPPWASASAPPAAEAPADPGAPVEPGAAAPEPTTPATADPCATGTAPFTLLVCDTVRRLGWTATATTTEISPATAFTVRPAHALARGEKLTVSRIQDGLSVIFTETGASDDERMSLTAVQEPLPAQSTASVADEIRGALGVDAIWFFAGEDIVDGPSVHFGPGWSIATKFDAARPVGTVVTAGSRTLTVTASAAEDGTFYRVN